MKNLILICSLIYSSFTYAVAPYGIKGQSQTTPLYSNVHQAPYNQVTNLGGINALIETGNENMLTNPGFESLDVSGTPTGWTCTTGTCTTEKTIFSSGKQAVKVVPASNIFDISQQVSTPANIQKQGLVGIVYNIPATCTTAQIQSLVDGSAQSTVPNANLILDGTYHYIEIPTVFGATSAAIRAFSTATCTGNIYFDAAVIKQGLGTQNLMLDNTYTAQVTTTSGAVSGQNKTFIASCTAVNPTVCTLSGFTVAPNCTATPTVTGTSAIIQLGSVTATSVTIGSYTPTTGVAVASIPLTLNCQKTGIDYLNSSGSVYVGSNADTEWILYTAPITNLGTTPTQACYYKFRGSDAFIRCNITPAATVGGSPATVGLPLSLISASDNTLNGGTVYLSAVGANQNSTIITASTNAAITFGVQSAGAAGLTPLAASSMFTAGTQFSFTTGPIHIANRPNPNTIIGAFAGYENISGVAGMVEAFKFNYGATSTSVCSTGTCAYLSQPGTIVSNVSVSGTTYTLNLAKSISKLYCVIIGVSPGSTNAVGRIDSQTPGTAFTFSTFGSTATATTSYGSADCTAIL